VLGEPDAELAARIEELFEAAEGCRKIIMAARAAVAAGGMLLIFIVFGPIAARADGVGRRSHCRAWRCRPARIKQEHPE
jgi:hypothetical protein